MYWDHIFMFVHPRLQLIETNHTQNVYSVFLLALFSLSQHLPEVFAPNMYH